MEASTDISKAELLNSYFPRQSTLDDHDQQLPHNITSIESTLSHLTITLCAVKDAISLIDSSKSSGPDFVSPKLLCEGSTELCTVLSHLFNSLLALSYFPSVWKLANVTPIFKKGDPSKPSNYRPISLLSCLGKLFERCVHKYLYNYLNDNRLLTKYQSGFIKGDSTTNQLIFIYDDINRALDEGLEVRALFCDISKAFDRVWHRGLLHKLSSLGICGPLLKWFSSYLTLRKQRVVCSNVSSDWSIINAGVPQGSILGPLLFLIYINDIVSQINTNVRLFADDTSLYVIVETPDQAATALNTDLEAVHCWSKTWLVSFNPSKTESIIFSRKRKKPEHPSLYMNNVAIKKCILTYASWCYFF